MKDGASELDGAFLGDVDGEQTAADIQITVDRAGVRWAIRKLGDKGQPVTVETADRTVWYYQLQVNRELRRQAGRSRPVVPNFKQRPKRRQPQTPQSVPCPVCHGAEPAVWHCDTCEGGGKVPK